jgi:hypothetical protein
MSTTKLDIAKRILESIKREYRIQRKRLLCKHTHTFSRCLPDDTVWLYRGEVKGTHPGLLIEGCYLCGRIEVRDWKA